MAKFISAIILAMTCSHLYQITAAQTCVCGSEDTEEKLRQSVIDCQGYFDTLRNFLKGNENFLVWACDYLYIFNQMSMEACGYVSDDNLPTYKIKYYCAVDNATQQILEMAETQVQGDPGTCTSDDIDTLCDSIMTHVVRKPFFIVYLMFI